MLMVVSVSLFLNTAATANGDWLKARSKNFELAGDASEKDLRDAATRFETLREAIRQTLKNVNLDSTIPIKIIVLKNEKLAKNLQSTNENYAADYLQNGEAAKYFVVYASDDKAIDYRRAFHDYAHFLISENLGRANIQPWLFEGLAANFETFQRGAENPNADYLSLLQQNKLIPLEAFFETDYYSLQKQENHGATLFYAQSWALTKYFLDAENGGKQAQLLKYIELVTKGKLAKESFKNAFQTDYATLEIELKKFIEQKNFAENRLSQNKIIVDVIKIVPISESESQIIVGDLFYQNGRYADAEKNYESALKSDSESSRVNSSLGLTKLKQGNSVAAEKYLERAVALDEKDFLAFYRFAYFLSREGMTDYGFASNYTRSQWLRTRELLDKSIELNPNFPESYNLYAFINYVRTEAIEQANDYAENALRLAPGNPRYQLRVAELAKLAEDFARARRIARRVYDTALDEKLRVYAKNTLYTIDTYESQMNGVKNGRYRRVLSEVTDQPLTDEESARLNWLAMLEAINQNLRRAKPNEKRILGFLTKIDCGANGIEYSVKTDGQILKLNSETFDSVMLMSYTAETSNTVVGCGAPKNPVFAVVVYRPSANTNAKSAGEIVSIEFVPQKFHFLY